MAYKDKAKTISYNNDFNREAYDRISLMVKKGQKEIIKQHAEKRGMSVNGYICFLIDKALADEQTDEPTDTPQV